jgi:AraC-like DNA-binding protein
MDGSEQAVEISLAVARVREFLDRTFVENVPLSRLAALAGCSRWHLCRQFSRCLGTTISRYRMQLRLHAAHARLERGAASIAALALDLGFSHHGHLSTAFRREFGESPSDWRRRAFASRRP